MQIAAVKIRAERIQIKMDLPRRVRAVNDGENALIRALGESPPQPETGLLSAT